MTSGGREGQGEWDVVCAGTVPTDGARQSWYTVPSLEVIRPASMQGHVSVPVLVALSSMDLTKILGQVAFLRLEADLSGQYPVVPEAVPLPFCP